MAHLVLGAATAHLLTKDNKPNVIHNHHYVPLSEAQADLYMTTQEYEKRLNTICKSIFLYVDRKGYYQAKPLVHRSTGEKREITFEQANILIDNEKKMKRESEKTILMTKGIGSLSTATVSRERERAL